MKRNLYTVNESPVTVAEEIKCNFYCPNIWIPLSFSFFSFSLFLYLSFPSFFKFIDETIQAFSSGQIVSLPPIDIGEPIVNDSLPRAKALKSNVVDIYLYLFCFLSFLSTFHPPLFFLFLCLTLFLLLLVLFMIHRGNNTSRYSSSIYASIY